MYLNNSGFFSKRKNIRKVKSIITENRINVEQTMKFNNANANASSVPKDRKVLLVLGLPYNEIKIAQYYEPWDNYVEEIPENPDVEHYGIGKLTIIGWYELPEIPKFKVSDKYKLDNQEINHLMASGVFNDGDLTSTFKHQKRLREKHGGEPCFECKNIAHRLGFEI